MVNADSLGIADGFADRFQSHHDIFVPIIEAGIDEKLLKVSANVSLRILWPVASRSRTKSVTRVSLTWLACVPSSRSLDFTRGFGGVAASSRRAAAQHTLLAIVQRRPADPGLATRPRNCPPIFSRFKTNAIRSSASFAAFVELFSSPSGEQNRKIPTRTAKFAGDIPPEPHPLIVNLATTLLNGKANSEMTDIQLHRRELRFDCDKVFDECS